MRTVLSPAFSATRCRSMAPLMAESAEAVVQHLKEQVSGELLMDVNEVISVCNEITIKAAVI